MRCARLPVPRCPVTERAYWPGVANHREFEPGGRVDRGDEAAPGSHGAGGMRAASRKGSGPGLSAQLASPTVVSSNEVVLRLRGMDTPRGVPIAARPAGVTLLGPARRRRPVPGDPDRSPGPRPGCRLLAEAAGLHNRAVLHQKRVTSELSTRTSRAEAAGRRICLACETIGRDHHPEGVPPGDPRSA